MKKVFIVSCPVLESVPIRVGELARYCEVGNSLFDPFGCLSVIIYFRASHFLLSFCKQWAFTTGTAVMFVLFFQRGLTVLKSFPYMSCQQGPVIVYWQGEWEGQKIDCEQSLFCSKIHGEGFKTSECASVTASVTYEPWVVWALEDKRKERLQWSCTTFLMLFDRLCQWHLRPFSNMTFQCLSFSANQSWLYLIRCVV